MFKIIMGVLSCWGFIVNGVFLAFFAKFVFANPDPAECWVFPLAALGEPQVVNENPNDMKYTDMATLFRTYMLVGFGFYIYSITKQCWTVIGCFAKSRIMMKLNNACGICDCIGLGLIIAGAILIWGESGSIAIGANAAPGEDTSMYLTEQGKFLNFYVMFCIIYGIVSCALICCCMCAGFVAAAGAASN